MQYEGLSLQNIYQDYFQTDGYKRYGDSGDEMFSNFLPSKRNTKKQQSKEDREIISIIEKDEVGRLKTLLAKKKIDISKPFEWNKYRKGGVLISPFFIAATRTETMIKFFLENGASVYDTTQLGETALHFTAMYRGSELGIVRLLVDAGININAQDTDRQYTALHCACENRNHGIVRMLLENFANPDVKDIHGNLPIDIATSVRCDQTVALLQKRGLEKKEDDFREFVRSTESRMKNMESQIEYQHRVVEIQMQQQSVFQEDMRKSLSSMLVELRSNQSLGSGHGRSSSLSDLPGRSNYSERSEHIREQQEGQVIQERTNQQPYAAQGHSPFHLQIPNNHPSATFAPNGYPTTVYNTQVMNRPTFQMHYQQAHLQAHMQAPLYQNQYRAGGGFHPLRSSSMQNVSHPLQELSNLQRSASLISVDPSQAFYQDREISGIYDDSALSRSVRSSSALSLNDERPDRPLTRKRYERLQCNIQELIEHLRPEPLLMKLFQRNILDHQMYDDLQGKGHYEQKRRIIMEIIMKGTNSSYNGFVEVVREQSGYLAGLLEADFADEDGS